MVRGEIPRRPLSRWRMKHRVGHLSPPPDQSWPDRRGWSAMGCVVGGVGVLTEGCDRVQLREYQSRAIDLLRERIRERPVYVSSTGTGKTVVAEGIVRLALPRGKRVLFVAHTREIVRQAVQRFPDAALFAAGTKPDLSKPVQVAMIQTLSRRDKTPDADLVIWDECHHVRAATYETVREQYAKAYHIGLTATPCRLDGRGLGTHFGAIVETITTREAIEQGYLARYSYWSVPAIDLGSIRKRGGDFDQAEVEEAMLATGSIFGDVAKHYRKHLDGGTALLFAPTIRVSVMLTDALRQDGIAAEHVDGKTPTTERDAIFARLASGETNVVSNVGIACEGFDCPSLDGVILCRPTQSFSLARQQIGRALRPPGPAVILDHAALHTLHGLPDDDVTWTLDDERKANKAKTGVPSCKVCGFVWQRPPDECPRCGYQAATESAPKKDPNAVNVDLVEITSSDRLDTEGRTGLYRSLLSDAHRHGYKIGWADIRYKDRVGSWYRGGTPKAVLVRNEQRRCRSDDCRFCVSVRARDVSVRERRGW